MEDTDTMRMERALRFLAENFLRRPSLEETAAAAKLSKFHFQRLFTRWAGISPGRFQQCLSLDHAKGLLSSPQANVLDVSLDAGLSGPGRLHDLFVTHEAVTPGEFKSRGEGLSMGYGFHPTPFGECVLLMTGRGIHGLAFAGPGQRAAVLKTLNAGWERATISERPEMTAPVVERIFGANPAIGPSALNLVLRGTNFQVNVWRALLEIAPGGMISYGALAARAGHPRAARAVGQAVARNAIAYLIPCHRVIRGLGQLGEYRWGSHRKRLLLAWEAARGLAGPQSNAAAEDATMEHAAVEQTAVEQTTVEQTAAESASGAA